MFALAIFIGIYSYLIFSLGLLGQLYKQNIFLVSAIFIVFVLYYFKKEIRFRKINLSIILILIIIQILINLIGALGPELGFDALWYHLSIPKIYLLNNSIFHIPGGLFYYSDMPKLTEMIYISALSFGNEILAKLIHFSFGILCLVTIYKLSRKFLDEKFSLITVLVFLGNLVVNWQFTTAYVDLTRTFFEVMAFWGFINWTEKKEKKWLIESAVMLGLAISTKLIALGSIFIFLGLLVFYKEKLKNILIYALTSFIIPVPWFIFSLINTGNPFYPLFSKFYNFNFNFNLLNPLNAASNFWNLFAYLADPISPLYLIFLPLIIINFKKFDLKIKPIIYYSIFSLIIWYFTPRTGGGRFIMPYLPVFSLLITVLIKDLSKVKFMMKISMSILILVSLLSIGYSIGANYKFIPVILGIELKNKFLSENLNFLYGDFYDTDNYFKNHISSTDKVLVYGFHNLYYVNFPFIDSSYIKKGDTFNFIAVHDNKIPERFKYWNLIYSNNKNHVNLYTLGGQKWVY